MEREREMDKGKFLKTQTSGADYSDKLNYIWNKLQEFALMRCEIAALACKLERETRNRGTQIVSLNGLDDCRRQEIAALRADFIRLSDQTDASIAGQGVLQPVVVRQMEFDKYELTAESFKVIAAREAEQDRRIERLEKIVVSTEIVESLADSEKRRELRMAVRAEHHQKADQEAKATEPPPEPQSFADRYGSKNSALTALNDRAFYSKSQQYNDKVVWFCGDAMQHRAAIGQAMSEIGREIYPLSMYYWIEDKSEPSLAGKKGDTAVG